MTKKTINIQYTPLQNGDDAKEMLEIVAEMIDKEIYNGHITDGFSLVTWTTTKESE